MTTHTNRQAWKPHGFREMAFKNKTETLRLLDLSHLRCNCFAKLIVIYSRYEILNFCHSISFEYKAKPLISLEIESVGQVLPKAYQGVISLEEVFLTYSEG
jgi:hypothetical protein